MADYERGTPNQQTDPWYFRLEANKGTHVNLVLSKLMADIYNGRLATDWLDLAARLNEVFYQYLKKYQQNK